MGPDRSMAPLRKRFRWAGVGLALALALLVAWASGLVWFSAGLPTAPPQDTRRTDAIVVLTGGSGRVQRGLALLAEGRAKKLFVSGVYQGVDVQRLLEVSQRSPQDLACCITLGYQADDTRGNAAETAEWMRSEGLTSLRLVTSGYHMPRSLLEFRRAMAGVDIIAHPVLPEGYDGNGWWPWPAPARVIATEYTKYLIAYLRGVNPNRAEAGAE